MPKPNEWFLCLHCGKRVTIAMAAPVMEMGVMHELPMCALFERLSAKEFLKKHAKQKIETE